MKTSARIVACLLTAGAILAPPIGNLLEMRMLSHMLLQMPLLVMAGMFCTGPSVQAHTRHAWNESGISGLLAVTLIATFWMLPIAIDRAAENWLWDAGKGVSLVLAGALARISLYLAPFVVKIFFVGNAVSMTIIVGQLYASLGTRLCNAYLVTDQAATGEALSWMPLAFVVAWAIGSCRSQPTTAPKSDV